jgi:hypothetical protein
MTLSAIPARLEFQCGHAALVSLPRIKGENSAQRNERVAREKVAAQARSCDFCGPDVAIVVQGTAPEVETMSDAVLEPVLEAVLEEVLEAAAAEATLAIEALADEASAEVALSETAVVDMPVLETVIADIAAVEPDVKAEVADDVVAEALAEIAQIVAAPIRRTRKPRVARATPKTRARKTPTVRTTLSVSETPAVEATPAVASRPVARKTHTAPSATRQVRQFTVHYRVERVIAASDIADALRRLTDLGATDVLAITRA